MSIEGAGLIAQVLPVLLLILVIERRALGPLEIPKKGSPRRARRIAFLFAGVLAVSFAFAAEWECVISVTDQQELPPWIGQLVGGYMLLLGAVVSITLVDLYAASVLGLDIFRQRQTQIDKRALIKSRAKHLHKLRRAKPKIRK